MGLELTAAVERSQSGDTQAFAELYSLVYKDLYRLALMDLGNEHDASDVVSDTVLEAYKNIKKLREPSSFHAWIMKILTAQINKRLKDYIAQREYREDIEDVEDTVADENTEIKFGRADLVQAMQRLAADERQVLSLSIVSGYTSEEIAEITGIPANTVRSKAARAKEKLRSYME